MTYQELEDSVTSNCIATLELKQSKRDCWMYEKGRVDYAIDECTISVREAMGLKLTMADILIE